MSVKGIWQMPSSKITFTWTCFPSSRSDPWRITPHCPRPEQTRPDQTRDEYSYIVWVLDDADPVHEVVAPVLDVAALDRPVRPDLRLPSAAPVPLAYIIYIYIYICIHTHTHICITIYIYIYMYI